MSAQQHRPTVVQIVNDTHRADDMKDHDEWISCSYWGMFTLGRKFSKLCEIIPRNIAGRKVGHPSRGERAIDLSASTHIIANALNTASTSRQIPHEFCYHAKVRNDHLADMLRSGLFDELKRMCAIQGKGDAPRSGR